MAKGSDTVLLVLLLGSSGNPLPLQLLDVMAGDGMLDSGDGVSDTLGVKTVGLCVFWAELLKWLVRVFENFSAVLCF